MRASPAYPRMTNRSYVKYVAMGALGFLVVFLFLSDKSFAETKSNASLSNIRGSHETAKLSDLLGVGMELSKQAAEVIKEVKKSGKEGTTVKGYTNEGVAEPVTVADASSNKIFVNGFRSYFGADIPILSEETEPEKEPISLSDHAPPQDLKDKLRESNQDPELSLSKVLIIVDPLDATKEFSEDLLEYVTTMVCVVYEGKPLAGIINQVFEDEKPPVVGVIAGGEGANGILYNRERQEPVDESAAHTVTISRSHPGEGGNVVEKYLPDHSVKRAGGAGFKSLLVLDGLAEAYVHVTAIKSWDVCAAEAVLKAGGGAFTDVEGKALMYTSDASKAIFTNGIVATGSKKGHQWFIDKLEGRLT